MRKIVSLFTMLMLVTILAFAQTRQITGRVVDESGQPVSGASVTIRGKSTGASADAEGNFTINAATGDVLVVSAVGIPSKEVRVASGGAPLTVSLSRQSANLSEVVVTTALGVRRQARELGYSTATVSNNELNQAKVINPVQGLTGKVSGLVIQSADASINPQVRVTLRGNRSILGNNQALVVVDGIIVPNDFLARLNPNDIETMNVLKGASASALYGSDASNGVLIVTTKRGTKGPPRINFSSTAQLETVSYMPKLQDEFGSYGGEDFSQKLGVQFPDDPFKIYFPYENQSYGPRYNGQMVPLGGPVRIYRADGTYYDSTQMVPYSAVKNGKRDFFDKGITLQNNISFSSGDATSQLYFSYQNVKVNGVVPGDRANRNTMRLNGAKEYGKFRIDFNTSYSLEKLDQTGGSYYQDRPVYWTVINAPQHAELRKYRDWRNDPFANPNGYFNAYYGNPWWQVDESRNVTHHNNFIGNIKLGLQITNWLSASYTVGYSRDDRSFKYTKAGFTFAPWAIADPWEAGAIPSSVKDLKPSLTDAFGLRERTTGDAVITASKDFGDISTKLIVGNTIYKTRERYLSSSSTSLVIPNFFNISNRQGEAQVSEALFETGLIGVYADLTLGYKNFLFLHGTGRNDWNSKLAPENRRFFYPSVDASFVFTDAIEALKGNRILNYGKVRASWAKVGQVSVDPYSLNNVVVPGGGFPYGSTAGYTLGNAFANPNLKPEFTTEKEVGLELGFLRSRINVKAAYYNAITTNQTIPSQISSATGYTSAVVNLGSMRNKGVELDLSLTPLVNLGDVRINFGANYSYNKNTVGDDLGGTISLGNSVYAIPGQPYPYLRESDFNRDPSGRIIVSSTTGFPSKANALSGFGTTIPPTKVGLNTSIAWKGLTLNVVADARLALLSLIILAKA